MIPLNRIEVVQTIPLIAWSKRPDSRIRSTFQTIHPGPSNPASQQPYKSSVFCSVVGPKSVASYLQIPQGFSGVLVP